MLRQTASQIAIVCFNCFRKEKMLEMQKQKHMLRAWSMQ